MDAMWPTLIAATAFSDDVLTLFGVVALLLSQWGYFSVVAYSARNERTRLEAGMALGAENKHVLRLVVGHGNDAGADRSGDWIAGAFA